MGDVGLLLVGVVLLVNGLVALGAVPARSAAPLNIAVGTAQVVLPTLVLVLHAGDQAVLQATWPSYLFGITYLWYGLQIIHDIEPEGFGWYSSFVAAIALLHAVTTAASNPVSAVMWASWAAMWSLFFVTLGLGRTHAGRLDLGRFTGWFLVLLGVPTTTVPALFLLDGRWTTAPAAGLAAAAAAVAATVVAVGLTVRASTRAATTEKTDGGTTTRGPAVEADQDARPTEEVLAPAVG